MFEGVPTTTIETHKTPDPYEALAFGIVQGNIDQLNRLLRKKDRVDEHPELKLPDRDVVELRDIEKFFYSDWFVFLVQDKINGPRLYKKLLDNYAKLGDVYQDHSYRARQS